MNKHLLLKDFMLFFMCACEGWNCEDGLEVKKGVEGGKGIRTFPAGFCSELQSIHLSCDLWRSKKPLGAGSYIPRCVQFHHFRQHAFCLCLMAETIGRNLFSGKEEILSVPYWDWKLTSGPQKSRMLVPAKPAVFVSGRVIEEHGVIVQQSAGLGCQH